MARTKYYHADEVAELLGITTDEVRGMLKRKELKGHKNGRRWFINMDQPCFDEHIEATPISEKQEYSHHPTRVLSSPIVSTLASC